MILRKTLLPDFLMKTLSIVVVMIFFASKRSEAVTHYFNTEVVGLMNTYCVSCHGPDPKGGGHITCASTSKSDCDACTGCSLVCSIKQPDFTDYNTAFCFASSIQSQVSSNISSGGVYGMPPSDAGSTFTGTDGPTIMDWVTQGALKDPILSGPQPPSLAITPPAIPITSPNSSSTFIFSVANSGGQSATGCSVTTNGADSGSYTVTNGCPTTIAVGTPCPVTVVFSPTVAAATVASLALNCTGPSALSVSQSINAVSATPTPTPVSPVVTITADTGSSFDFGQVIFGKTVTQNFTVTVSYLPANVGAFTCAISFNGPFSTTSTCTSPGGSTSATCAIAVTATPVTANPVVPKPTYGTFDVNCGAPATASASVAISVNGVCPFGGQYQNASRVCQCPTDYDLLSFASGNTECRPRNPSYPGSKNKTDFFRAKDALSTLYPIGPYNGFPACGSSRIAVPPSSVPLDISASTPPNSLSSVSPLPGDPGGLTNVQYRYAQPSGGTPQLPIYLYPKGSRCACALRTYDGLSPNPSLPSTSGSTGLPSVVPAIPADHYNGIKNVTVSTQQSSNPVAYSPVAIAFDSSGSTDGRSGTEWYPSANAQCGCPNLNEVQVATYPTNVNTPQGAYCRSIFADPVTGIINPKTNPNVVLVTFNPAIHDITGSSQVQNRANEPKDPNNTNNIISKIALPTSIGGVQTQIYKRRIWTCAAGYTIDKSVIPATCTKPNAAIAKHQCDDGSGGGLPSAVSSSVTGGGTSLAVQFNNAVNKKLSCCMNDHTKGQQNYKFDCIDNSVPGLYQKFDDLWTTKDPVTAGGQLNAIVLGNSSGQIISGFYSLNGKRCAGFSEFGGTISTGTVDPKTMIFAADTGGAVIPPTPPTGLPLSAVAGGAVPATAADRLACPILVRAAITTHCSTTNPPLPAYQTYFHDDLVSVGSLGENRCSVADRISVFVQVKQITQIVGQKTLKTFDTIATPSQAATISVSKLITSKSADCPDGATWVGNQCVFQ